MIRNEIIIGMGGWINIKLDEKFKTINMKLEKNKLLDKFGKSIIFKENLSKYSWFNLGGPAEIFLNQIVLNN